MSSERDVALARGSERDAYTNILESKVRDRRRPVQDSSLDAVATQARLSRVPYDNIINLNSYVFLY